MAIRRSAALRQMRSAIVFASAAGSVLGIQENELFAAAPYEDVDAPRGRPHPFDEHAQHLIADDVAVGVVHPFEVVEIEQEHAHRVARPPRALHLFEHARREG